MADKLDGIVWSLLLICLITLGKNVNAELLLFVDQFPRENSHLRCSALRERYSMIGTLRNRPARPVS